MKDSIFLFVLLVLKILIALSKTKKWRFCYTLILYFLIFECKKYCFRAAKGKFIINSSFKINDVTFFFNFSE